MTSGSYYIYGQEVQCPKSYCVLEENTNHTFGNKRKVIFLKVPTIILLLLYIP